MGAWKNATQAEPMRGVVGRAASTSVFDIDRWAPSDAGARFVEHFWSVRWDLREQGPFDSTVITFPSMHIADLAVRLGWYDQAHFINDFRTMLGSTPGEYPHQHGG